MGCKHMFCIMLAKSICEHGCKLEAMVKAEHLVHSSNKENNNHQGTVATTIGAGHEHSCH